MTGQEVLGSAAEACKQLLIRFLANFDDNNRTQQAPNLPNHVMWCLGHVSLYLNRVAERLDGKPLPESDFVSGDGKGGVTKRFNVELVSFGAQPETSANCYPTLARGQAIFEAACDRMAAAVSNADEAALRQQVEWGETTMELKELILRVMFHSGLHTGEIVDLRRALNLGRVIA